MMFCTSTKTYVRSIYLPMQKVLIIDNRWVTCTLVQIWSRKSQRIVVQKQSKNFWRLFEVVSARWRPRRGRKMGESPTLGTDGVAEVLGYIPARSSRRFWDGSSTLTKAVRCSYDAPAFRLWLCRSICLHR